MRNQVVLTGRPIRYEEKQLGGLRVAKVTLYLPGRKVGDNKLAQFFRIDIWGVNDSLCSKITSIVNNRFRTEMVVSGQLEYTEWSDSNGNKRNHVGIKADARDIAFRTSFYSGQEDSIVDVKTPSTNGQLTQNTQPKTSQSSRPAYVPSNVSEKKKSFNPQPSPPKTETIGEDEIPF